MWVVRSALPLLGFVLLVACGGGDEGDDPSGAGGASTGGSGAAAGEPGTGGMDTGGTGTGGAGTGGAGTGGNAPCAEGCVLTLAASCSNGPPDQATCVADCEALGSGPCAADYRALQECAAEQPVTCNEAGIPWIEPCAAEQTAFIGCLS